MFGRCSWIGESAKGLIRIRWSLIGRVDTKRGWQKSGRRAARRAGRRHILMLEFLEQKSTGEAPVPQDLRGLRRNGQVARCTLVMPRAGRPRYDGTLFIAFPHPCS